MDKFQRVKETAIQVLKDFCQADEDLPGLLDDEEIDLLSDALAQALLKGCKQCDSK